MYCPKCETLYTGVLSELACQVKVNTKCLYCDGIIQSDEQRNDKVRNVRRHVCMYNFGYNGKCDFDLFLEKTLIRNCERYNYKYDKDELEVFPNWDTA